MKFNILTSAAVALTLQLCFPYVLYGQVTVRTSNEVGPIKLMNAVNNGPSKSNGDQVRDNFQLYCDAEFPYARTHDANFSSSYGGPHTVDITAIFPDFSKNVNDPASYDFVHTDNYLKTTLSCGTKIFFRLGQSIEHGVKKYGIYPPADFKKWAEICEHIIRHYNEGWANGYNFNIEYWEIWNEPDLDSDQQQWKVNPRTWAGSKEQFFKFYEIAANHLNKCFPDLKIGGPALAFNEVWSEDFLKYMSEHKVELDFYSWHIYNTQAENIASMADRIRAQMNKYGYGEIESILNEWNYVKGWTEDYPYSVKVMNSLKGAAFVASTLSLCQKKPVDMLMYYDARVHTIFNGLFDYYDFSPKEAYYVFYAWNKLLKLGTEIESSSDAKDIYVVAAKKGKARTGILVTRYNEDNNVTSSKVVDVKIDGIDPCAEIFGYITDESRRFTQIPLHLKDGGIKLILQPNSIVYIEIM